MDKLVFVPFLIVAVLFALLYSKGKKEYAAYAEALDKKTYNLKDFMVVGYALMAMIGYKYTSSLDRKMRKQLIELYPEEYVDFYLITTWALAGTNLMLGLAISTLFFAAMEGDVLYLGLGLALTGVLIWAAFQDTEKQVEKRRGLIAMDLPDLTNQIVILSGAGLTLRGALVKISDEMPSERPLYQMLGKAVEKMNQGTSDDEALEVLSVRCNTPEMRRFVSVIVQNMHRGGSDVIDALREIGKELWTARKAAAQRVAEETSTKLLFPMMLMLLAVIILVAAPAVMGMQY